MSAAAGRLWTSRGARVTDDGVAFAVWAPHAREVRLVGDFTGWGSRDGLVMRAAGGVWEILVPGVPEGARYRYRILGADGRWRDKDDPLAGHTAMRPGTGSVVHRSRYRWGDEDWMTRRAARDPHREPMSVYEVHLGSWRPGLGYRELADELTAYVRRTGFTHVEFLPVMDHPFGGSWGYQATGYFAPMPALGSPDEFRLLVDALHRAGIGVILDWVPAYFARDEWALARFDGTPLYEHAGPRGEHPDWGTYVFDHGRHEVRDFLVANALYWCEEFHADALRVDAVASMLYLDYSRRDGEWRPNRYGGNYDLDAIFMLRELTSAVHRECPGVLLIAEESTSFPGVTAPVDDGGLGFDLKWNLGWMHDTLSYLGREPERRHEQHHRLAAPRAWAFGERYLLPISHDEVVHGKASLTGKMPGDPARRLANARALLAYMWAYPGKKLLFMGAELGDDREWSHARGLDWDLLDDPGRAGLQRLVTDLNAAYRARPALWAQDSSPAGVRWTLDDEDGNAVAFLRIAPDGDTVVCVANFSGADLTGYRVGMPYAGRWVEVLNTDAGTYGGSGARNLDGVDTEDVPWQGLPVSAVLRVPSFGVLWLRPG